MTGAGKVKHIEENNEIIAFARNRASKIFQRIGSTKHDDPWATNGGFFCSLEQATQAFNL